MAPLDMHFKVISFLPKSKFSDSGRKPWTIARCFDKFNFYVHSYPSLGSATKLKFAPFYYKCI